MTITLQAVNELIQSLESAGELSIREQKFLKLAKAYQQLAAENVGLKQQEPKAWYIRMVDEVTTDREEAKMWRGVPLVMGNIETPATDRIVAETEARGIEKGIAHLENKFSNIGVQIMNLQWLADSLREGAK